MPQTNRFQLVVCPDADTLAERAVERIINASANAIAARGRFTLALTGGSTPEKTYTLLALPGQVERIDWAKTYLFFGDERFVPLDDPRSNHALARRTLLSRAPIAAENIFPIPTDRASAARSAAEYARTLADFFSLTPDQGVPRFDLILLGMGDDGHVASLFPGMPTLHEQTAWVTSSPPGVLPPPVERVTLTFPVLNAGREVLFLVVGEKKADPLHEVLESPANVDRRPASGVHPTDGSLIWLVDEAAARLLHR